jgi:general secretion pathway protein F
MPVYEYTAIDAGGKKVKGSIDADSVRGARQKLRSKKIFPTDIREGIAQSKNKSQDVTRYIQSNRISPKDLSVMTRQLATLLGAGLPLVSALSALSDQTDSALNKRICIDIKERVEEGSTLASSLKQFPKSFPRLYINMVNSGEASGKLDAVLANLADYLESQIALRHKIRSATTYPILMLCFSVLVILALFVVVIPKLVDMFEQQGLLLPLPTRVMIVISNMLVSYWWLVPFALIGLVAGVRAYYAQEQGRYNIDKLILRLPLFGSLYTKVCTARVALTLSALLGSGVQLLNALDITKRIMGNVHLESALQGAREGVQEGKSLAKELRASGLFPSMLCHMIAVGEKSGALESMLEKAGQAYENDVNSTVEGLTSILEPILMIIVGMVVLAVVISVLLPMAELVNQLQ